MNRTRHVSPPSQKPATVRTFFDGDVSSTVSSVSGAVVPAANMCSHRLQIGTDWAFAAAVKMKRQNTSERRKRRYLVMEDSLRFNDRVDRSVLEPHCRP